jgi:hypothetical protein
VRTQLDLLEGVAAPGNWKCGSSAFLPSASTERCGRTHLFDVGDIVGSAERTYCAPTRQPAALPTDRSRAQSSTSWASSRMWPAAECMDTSSSGRGPSACQVRTSSCEIQYRPASGWASTPASGWASTPSRAHEASMASRVRVTMLIDIAAGGMLPECVSVQMRRSPSGSCAHAPWRRTARTGGEEACQLRLGSSRFPPRGAAHTFARQNLEGCGAAHTRGAARSSERRVVRAAAALRSNATSSAR